MGRTVQPAGPEYWDAGSIGVRLEEVYAGVTWTGEESGYRVGRFRPLHTLESDVALFAHLLTPAPTSPMLPSKELTDQ